MRGMIRALIWGSLTPLRAPLRGVIIEYSTRPTSSVCRLGRDSRHLMNGGTTVKLHARCTVKNLQGIWIRSSTQGRTITREYFTVVARDTSACKTFAMALSVSTKIHLHLLGNSRRSHTHGSNRNRIVLHVMLSGRRNSTCRR